MPVRTVLALALVGCSAPASKPTAESTTAAVVPVADAAPRASGCEALFESWRAEDLEGVDDEGDRAEIEAELDEASRAFQCPLILDLDGDEKSERVTIASNGDKVGIKIHWGAGGSEVLGAGTAKTIASGEGDIAIEDDHYGWIRSWKHLAKATGGFELVVLGRKHTFAAPDRLGEGIQISSLDAAVVIYLSKDGWRWRHLGF